MTTAKLKIIQICAAYKPAFVYGGPTMSVAKLSETLTKAGQDVTVLTTTANGKTELEVPIGKETLVDGVKVYYFKRLTKDHTHFSPSLLKFLHQTLKEAKRNTSQTIVHIHAWWNLVSIFSCFIAKLHGAKVILSPRGMLTSYSLTNRNAKFKHAIHYFLGKKLLKYCHIHATSNKEHRDILQTGEVSEVTVIPNFVEFPDLVSLSAKSPLNIEGDTYRLIFLSRIEEKKGLALLFEALAVVTIPWTLSIAGTGDPIYERSLQKLATELKIENRIKWLGHISNHQKFDLIAQHDLLLLPSYNENFANVVIESLAMGTPVLISEEVGLADIVLQHNLGWVSALTTEELSETINISFSKKAERDEIRRLGPKVIHQLFDESILLKRYTEMYKNLIANGNV